MKVNVGCTIGGGVGFGLIGLMMIQIYGGSIYTIQAYSKWNTTVYTRTFSVCSTVFRKLLISFYRDLRLAVDASGMANLPCCSGMF